LEEGKLEWKDTAGVSSGRSCINKKRKEKLKTSAEKSNHTTALVYPIGETKIAERVETKKKKKIKAIRVWKKSPQGRNRPSYLYWLLEHPWVWNVAADSSEAGGKKNEFGQAAKRQEWSCIEQKY